MRIDSRHLFRLPVFTVSGMRLGRVLSMELDVETHAVTRYVVGQRRLFGGKPLLISPAQVVSITVERMTVADGAVSETAAETAGNRTPVPTAPSVATRDR